MYVHAYLVNCVGPTIPTDSFELSGYVFHRCQHKEWTVADKVCTMVSSTIVKTMFLKEGFSMGTPDLV